MKPQRTQRKTLCTLWLILTLTRLLFGGFMNRTGKISVLLILFLLFSLLPLADSVGEVGAEEALLQELRPYFENIGVVNTNIIRGAQPELDQLFRLKDAGVVSVLNLRSGSQRIEKEREKCKEVGLKYFSLPWGNSRHAVKHNVIYGFLQLISDPANLPVFVHCKRGAERTGTVIAVYRVKHDHWTAEEAYQEMKKFKFRSFWFRHLKQYVFDFEKNLNKKKEKNSGSK